MIKVMLASAEHYDSWRAVWDLHTAGKVTEKITAATWERIVNPAAAVSCLFAIEFGKIVGSVTLVRHEGTRETKPTCYVEELYIAESHQKDKRDVATALVAAVLAKLEEGEWSRIYGIARADNVLAQRLYKYFEKGDPYKRYVIRKTAK